MGEFITVKILLASSVFLLLISVFLLLLYLREKRKGKLKDEELEMTLHDIKAPSSSILSALDMLYTDPEEKEEYLRIIRENALQIANISSSFLAQKDKIEINLEDISARELVGMIKKAFEPDLKKEKISFEQDIDDFHFEADRTKLVQVISNIISNSIKHTRGGKIEVQVKKGVIFRISDTGEGIPDDIAKKIFEKGVSGRESTGLGLWIAKKLVEAHGGKIWIERTERGTTVGFFIPIYTDSKKVKEHSVKEEREKEEKVRPSLSQAMKVSQQANMKFSGKKALVVDDNEDHLFLLKRVLERFGMQVITSQDAFEGFSLLEKENPDVVFLDILMPGRSGYDFLKKMKEKELSHIPVVVVSNLYGKDKALRLGAKVFVEKPISTEKIRYALEKVFGEENKR